MRSIQILYTLLAACTTFFIGSPVIAQGQSWPGWMGVGMSGVTQETGWSSNWPEQGLPVQWTRQIGIGFSSVSVADGRLYTMGHVSGKEFVYCLDARSGETIWSHQYPCELVDNLYEGGPGSTPTVAEDRVWTLGKQGQMFCFDSANGDVIWELDLQKELDVEMPEWGFNGSAVILGENLLLEAGRVVSFNKHTGHKNWQSDKHAAGYGSVAIMSDHKPPLLATLDCDALRITDSASARQIDSFPWKSPFGTNSTTPIIADGKIFISTGYQVGCALFEFKDNKLQPVYDNRDMRNHFNNSVLYNGYLYGFDGNSNLGRVVHLVCMNFETGKVAWRKRGLGCGSLIVADGKLLILSDAGQLVLAGASPDAYREISRSDFLDGRCWTIPVLVGGHIYGRNAAGTLRCVKLSQ